MFTYLKPLNRYHSYTWSPRTRVFTAIVKCSFQVGGFGGTLVNLTMFLFARLCVHVDGCMMQRMLQEASVVAACLCS